jgi:hypothetical protein
LHENKIEIVKRNVGQCIARPGDAGSRATSRRLFFHGDPIGPAKRVVRPLAPEALKENAQSFFAGTQHRQHAHKAFSRLPDRLSLIGSRYLPLPRFFCGTANFYNDGIVIGGEFKLIFNRSKARPRALLVWFPEWTAAVVSNIPASKGLFAGGGPMEI